jgi:AcrR family transcriptional regulator
MNTYKKDTKQHILETAFKLFLQKSYKATTLKDIIQETGLSNGGFYHHFESKEQLFKEVIDHYLFRVARRVYEYYPKDSLWSFIQDTLEDMEKIHKKLDDFLEMNSGYNFVFFLFEALRQFPEIQKEAIELHRIEFASWVEIIDLAKAKGEIKSEVSTGIIARMFTYLPDGAYLDFLVDNNMEKYRLAPRSLWEGLYNMLQT